MIFVHYQLITFFLFFISLHGYAIANQDLFDEIVPQTLLGQIIDLSLQLWDDLEQDDESLKSQESLIAIERHIGRLRCIEYHCEKYVKSPFIRYENIEYLLYIMSVLERKYKNFHIPDDYQEIIDMHVLSIIKKLNHVMIN